MRVAVIGGTGTIGKEVVKKLSERHEVVISGRSSGDVHVDITSADAIRSFFEEVGPLDAVVCAAGEATFKPMSEMTDADYEHGLFEKLMGQVNVVRIGRSTIRDGGSLTLTSGITAREPMPGGTAYSMVNSAIEGFVRAAALDLDRSVRINAVSPQWTTTTLEKYGMDPGYGVPSEDVAPAYVEAIEGSMTGTVIDAAWRYDWAGKSLSVGPT